MMTTRNPSASRNHPGRVRCSALLRSRAVAEPLTPRHRPASLARVGLPDERSAAFPPESWHLVGQMVLLLWSVPGRVVIPRLPRGLTPVMRRERALVGTAWVDFTEGGVLVYRELLSAVAVLHGGRPAISITHSWVDSPAARAGGRALWAIPKELAGFSMFDGHRFRASLTAPSDAEAADAEAIATATWTPGRRLPGRWPVRFCVVQDRSGALVSSRVRSTVAVVLGTATMDVNPSGPLDYLAGLAPLRACSLADFDVHFGG